MKRNSIINLYGKNLIKEISSGLKNQNSLFNENFFSEKNVSNLNSFLIEKNLSISSIEYPFNQTNKNIRNNNEDEVNEIPQNFQKSKNSIMTNSRKESNHEEKTNSEFKSFLNKTNISFLVIYHDTTSKKIWDQLIFILILFTVSMTPIYLCLFENNQIFSLIEILIEIIFIIDFILNFFTTFLDRQENKVRKLRLIVENYVFSWFLFDLLILCPFDIISVFFPYNFIIFTVQKYYIIKFTLFKWIKMFRLIKLFKIESTGKFISILVLNDNYRLNRVFKFVFLFLILTHIASCFFIFIGFTTLNDLNWIHNANLLECSKFDLYIASLYYMLVTIYSVGYGDILPINIWEKLAIIVFMFIGSMLYSYAVSSLSTIFSEKNKKYFEYKRKVSVLKSIDEENQLPSALYNKIKQNIKNDFKNNQNEKFEFIESLPSNIRNDLILLIYQSIKQQKFFNNQANDFLLFVLPFLKFHKILKTDVLISAGEIIDEMYFVLKGDLSLNLELKYENYEISQIKEGKHFGDLLIQTNELCPFELKCKCDFSELLVLKKSDYQKIKLSFIENILEILKESLIEFEIFNRRKQIIIEMFKNGESSKNIKKKMRQLNLLFLQWEFNNNSEKDIIYEDNNDLILNYDLKNLKVLMDYLDDPNFILNTLNGSKEHLNIISKNCSKRKSLFLKRNSQKYNELLNRIKKTDLYNPSLLQSGVKNTNNITREMNHSNDLGSEMNHSNDLSSFNSKSNKKKVFNKYYARLSKRINSQDNCKINKEKKFNNRMSNLFITENQIKNRVLANNNSFSLIKPQEILFYSSNDIFNFKKKLSPNNSILSEKFNQDFIIEKAVDLHLIYSREIENMNLLMKLKTNNVIQNQSFSIIKNCPQSFLSKNIENKSLYLNNRNTIDNIIYKMKANRDEKKLNQENNPFLNYNSISHLENNDKEKLNVKLKRDDENNFLNIKLKIPKKNYNDINIQDLSIFEDEKRLGKNLNRRLDNLIRLIKKFQDELIETEKFKLFNIERKLNF